MFIASLVRDTLSVVYVVFIVAIVTDVAEPDPREAAGDDL